VAVDVGGAGGHVDVQRGPMCRWRLVTSSTVRRVMAGCSSNCSPSSGATRRLITKGELVRGISQLGTPVALASRDRFWLAAAIEALPAGHARRIHVAFMALYARDVLAGETPAPYTDAAADRFARLVVDAAAGPITRSGPAR
jgi:hypothetical protein